MTATPETPAPLRVEQALRVVPDVDALAPLRALLIASSRPDDRGLWASSGPYLTVGKRYIEPADIRRLMPQVLDRVHAHLALLYQAVVEAMEAEQRGDVLGAVHALVGAGAEEESAGRSDAAVAWYGRGLVLAEGMPDRRAEIATLQRLGRLCLKLNRYGEGARYYQRSLALAEAGGHDAEAIDSCEGLGHLALAEQAWVGAQAWYGRGLRLAEAAGDARGAARMQHSLGTVALRRGDLAAAQPHLERALESFERLSVADDMARALNTQGQLEVALGRHGRASGAYREALAWTQRTTTEPGLEVAIRLNLAELYLEMGRYLEAEEEARRAERGAIAHTLTRRLIHIYTFLGKLRGRQVDEAGFVFFEKALELCRGTEGSPMLEGQVYREYATFRSRLGQVEEARILLERAREIFEALGERPELERVQAQLLEMSA